MVFGARPCSSLSLSLSLARSLSRALSLSRARSPSLAGIGNAGTPWFVRPGDPRSSRDVLPIQIHMDRHGQAGDGSIVSASKDTSRMNTVMQTRCVGLAVLLRYTTQVDPPTPLHNSPTTTFLGKLKDSSGKWEVERAPCRRGAGGSGCSRGSPRSRSGCPCGGRWPSSTCATIQCSARVRHANGRWPV